MQARRSAAERLAGFGILLLTIAALFTVTAAAQNSQISTTICNNQPPVIQVIQPTDGATVETAEITVQGTVDGASLLTLQLNNAHITALNIPYSDSFSIPVTLTPGDNILLLEAELNCNGTDSAETIHVHFDAPPIPPDPQPDPKDPARPGAALPGDALAGGGTPSIIDRIKDNLTGKPRPDPTGGEQYDVSYVVLTRSWTVFLLAAALFFAAFMPNRYYKNQTTIQRRGIRIAAFLLAFVCLVILQM